MTTITLPPDLEEKLAAEAQRQGTTAAMLALDSLRKLFVPATQALQDRPLPKASSLEPRDEWERGLFEAAIDCGVSLPDSALSSDALYD